MKIPDTKLRMVKVTPGPGAGTGGGDDDEAAAEMAGAAPSTEAVIAALNTSLLPLRCGHSDEAALYVFTRSAAVYGGVGGYSPIRPGLVGLTPGQFREIRCGSEGGCFYLLVPQIDPLVPQPVVQSRRRPLLGPYPG